MAIQSKFMKHLLRAYCGEEGGPSTEKNKFWWKTSMEKLALQSEHQVAPQLRDLQEHITNNEARYPTLVLISTLLSGN